LDFKSELIFWTGIMSDHAMFQVNSLVHTEKAYIEHSMFFHDYFKRVNSELEGTSDYQSLLQNMLQQLQQFIEYKRLILKKLNLCQLQMNLPPSLISHQINEAKEFQTLLLSPQQSLCTMMNLAGYIKIWLGDSAGHAAAIAVYLDPVEDLLQEDALSFKMIFARLQIKALELEMMMNQTGLKDTSLKQLVNETINSMTKFIEYLEKIRELRMSCEIQGFGTFSPLIPDHFIREHVYFIAKIKDCLNNDC